MELYCFLFGGLTAYFDLMSAPIMSYLYIMLFVIYFGDFNIKTLMKKIILSGIAWLGGYLGLWSINWLIISLVLKENVSADVLNEIFRMTHGLTLDWAPDNKWDLLKDTITLNWNQLIMADTINRFTIFVKAFLGILMIFWTAKSFSLKDVKIKLLGMMVIAVIPFGWFICANNQAFIFYNLSYRILGPTVMAIAFIALEGVGNSNFFILKDIKSKRKSR